MLLSQSPSHTAKRIPALDFLRSIAIIIVFFWHYHQHGSPAWVAAVGRFGWSGVDLFFVLSGYLIGGQLMQQAVKSGGINFKDFYLRRFFRIMPAYLAILLLYFTVPGFRERDTIAPLWRFLTFTQNFGLDLRNEGAFSHAWSLCIEEQFYLLLPLILLLVFVMKWRKAVPYILLTVFAAGFALRYYSWQHFVAPLVNSGQESGFEYYKWIYYPTYNRLDGLLAGVAIAATQQFMPLLWERICRYGNAILATGILLLGCAYVGCEDMGTLGVAVLGYPLVSVAYGCIVLAALSPQCLLARMRFSMFGGIATLAYCIYLSHKQLNHLTRELLANHNIADNGNLMFIICVAVAIAGGWLLHLIIEKPFLLLRGVLLKQG